MNIKNIYCKFQTPQNLQEHMLRVGALARILTDNWTGRKIDKQNIVKAALLHDIAKPLSFDLSKQAQFDISPKDIKSLAKLQNFLKKKFGNDEHTAMSKIVQELGLNQTIARIINNLEWRYIPQLIKNHDIETLIVIYCDMRIGPKGILSLNERIADLKTRSIDENFEEHLKNSETIEQIIKKNVSIKIEDITDRQINTLSVPAMKFLVDFFKL